MVTGVDSTMPSMQLHQQVWGVPPPYCRQAHRHQIARQASRPTLQAALTIEQASISAELLDKFLLVSGPNSKGVNELRPIQNMLTGERRQRRVTEA